MTYLRVIATILRLDRSRDIDNFWLRDTGGRGNSVSAPAYYIVVTPPARAAPLTVLGIFVQVEGVLDLQAAVCWQRTGPFSEGAMCLYIENLNKRFW